MTSETSSCDFDWVQVGSIVRAPREGAGKARALVATLSDGAAQLLWEDLAPHSLSPGQSFRISPLFPAAPDDHESTVALKDLMPLLDFERKKFSDQQQQPVAVWKEWGDALLRLGDPSSAVPYYEEAISVSHSLQVGGTVLLKSKKVVLAAEVDCIEDKTADVTLVDTEEEKTVPLSEIFLCLLPGDEKLLQVRILLNLARCLLQLAELDREVSLERPSRYRAAAALSSSMALLADNDTESRFHRTALLLRSQALGGRGKWKAALADAESLLQLQPQHKEGRAWKKQLEANMTSSRQSNRKLAKEMCKLVQSATNASSQQADGDSTTVSKDPSNKNSSTGSDSQPHTCSTVMWWLMLAISMLLLIWLRLLPEEDDSATQDL